MFQFTLVSIKLQWGITIKSLNISSPSTFRNITYARRVYAIISQI